MQLSVPLPGVLLRQLVDEWERITKQGLLPPLPRRPSIDAVLATYQVRTALGLGHRSQGLGA